MKVKYLSFVFCLSLVVPLLLLTTSGVDAVEDTKEDINLGNWTEPELDVLMWEKSKKPRAPERIDFLSGKFLGTPYAEHTLTGAIDTPEVFTIDLEGMDCFTYIDYVEALRISETYPEFKNNLQDIRYRGGIIAFQNRNHFFTDWPVNNPKNVKDVTHDIGGDKAVSVKKTLNVKKDGSKYLPGIPANEREFYYIPSGAIDEAMVSKLNTGDYVGIYTDLPGLDVTHTGIVIKKNGRTFLRHASSRKVNYRVVDEDLFEYMQNKPGLVVFRPVNIQ
jgi:N-acetylmuramoyl-L-alanine amidase-like